MQVAGVGAKHVGFLTVVNNIIVCHDKAYSAVSVWDESKTVRGRYEVGGLSGWLSKAESVGVVVG